MFTFEVPFKRLFAPTSQRQMSKIFKDTESLGKSNGKKWSLMLTFLLKKCLKCRSEIFFDVFLFPLITTFKRFFVPTSQRPMSKLFKFSQFLGKTNGKKWSQIQILLVIKGIKSPRKKSLIFDKFCLTSRIFLVSVLLSASVERCFVSCMQDFFSSVNLNKSSKKNAHKVKRKK